MVETTAAEEKKKKVKIMKRTEDSFRDLGDNIKHTNIQIRGVPEEEKKAMKKTIALFLILTMVMVTLPAPAVTDQAAADWLLETGDLRSIGNFGKPAEFTQIFGVVQKVQ